MLRRCKLKFLSILLYLLVFKSRVTLSQSEIDLNNSDCGKEGTISLVEGQSIKIIGCPESFISLHIPVISSGYTYKLNIEDSGEKKDLVFTNAAFVESDYMSKDTQLTLTLESGSLPEDLEFGYKGHPRVDKADQTYGPGNVSFVLDDVAANYRQKLIFQAGEPVSFFDLDWDFASPLDGFVAVRNPNGRMALLSSDLKKYALASDTGRTVVDIVTQRSVQKFKPISIDASVEEQHTTTPPSTTTTTTTPDPNSLPVDLYVVAVNEMDFYEQHLPLLQDFIQNLADAHTNTSSTNCPLDYSAAVSCRQSCYMTTRTDRGCVAITVAVEPSIFCGYSNTWLRSDLTGPESDALQRLARDEFGAKRVSVDDCFEEEHGWVIMVFVVPVAMLAVLVAGMLVARVLVKRQRRRMWSTPPRSGRQNKSMQSTTPIAAGSSNVNANAHSNAPAIPSYYDNPLEVVDEE